MNRKALDSILDDETSYTFGKKNNLEVFEDFSKGEYFPVADVDDVRGIFLDFIMNLFYAAKEILKRSKWDD